MYRNVYLSLSNANDKDIKNDKNRHRKTKITLHDNPSDKCKESVHVEEVEHNEPGDSLIFFLESGLK